MGNPKGKRMRRKRKTDPGIITLIEELRRSARTNKAPIWRDVARRLEKPRRNYAEVNLSKINRYSTPNDTILIPGKVLSAGILDHQVTVAALSFSKRAFEKINKSGKCMSIEELVKNNPKGSRAKIIV
jgi:large subunit ribosomal protein L18e